MAPRIDAASLTPDDLDRRQKAVMDAVIETSDPHNPVDRKTVSVARLAMREAETRMALRRKTRMALHRWQARAQIVHVPERRENVARPRESIGLRAAGARLAPGLTTRTYRNP